MELSDNEANTTRQQQQMLDHHMRLFELEIPQTLVDAWGRDNLGKVHARVHRYIRPIMASRDITAMGGAIGLVTSLLEHACMPNCIITNHRDELVVITTRPVKQGEPARLPTVS
jgi:hypothetical protein